MSYIDNLSDSRRSAKPWLPQDDRDVTNGLVIQGYGYDGLPLCIRHGAMHRIDPNERIFRCSECGVGARHVATNSPEGKRRFSKEWDARV